MFGIKMICWLMVVIINKKKEKEKFQTFSSTFFSNFLDKNIYYKKHQTLNGQKN